MCHRAGSQFGRSNALLRTAANKKCKFIVNRSLGESSLAFKRIDMKLLQIAICLLVFSTTCGKMLFKHVIVQYLLDQHGKTLPV